MEEWHQKLHNNTSPDDVVICQVVLITCSITCSMLFFFFSLSEFCLKEEWSSCRR